MPLTTKKYIHPFPARMAPEIAIKALQDLQKGDTILDPMAGSGTVLHHAALNGYIPLGFDLDPLAVLISKVITNQINKKRLLDLYIAAEKEIKTVKLKQMYLPWIDDCKETKAFINFWFAKNQKDDLRKIAYVLCQFKAKHKRSIEVDVLRIALSRIIITKKIGASLAWDISHSRPHKMRDENDYNVNSGFENSVRNIAKYLEQQGNIQTRGVIKIGDARNLKGLPNQCIDKVITSPPYLNAIDYMRGNKFSLVWLGYSITALRQVRSNLIGAEKKLDAVKGQVEIENIYQHIFGTFSFGSKYSSMIKRYINDSVLLMSEIARVLKAEKTATLVVGNSNLRGNYIDNSAIFREAGERFGLQLIETQVREIPLSKRYLPVPVCDSNSLSKRMKHEVIMTFINRPVSH